MLSEKINTVAFSPIPVRIKFRKVGLLQYISHLDLQRTFEKALVRAGLPVWYTQGFNPHAKMVFSLPLSVGAQSEVEYLDIKITESMPFEEIKNRLNAVLTKEMGIIDVYSPIDSFSDIGWARYKLEFSVERASEALAKKAQELFSSPVIMKKRSKSGEKDVDITPLIKSLSAEYDGEKIKIDTLLSASSTDFLNPEMLVSALKERLGFLSGDILKESYNVFRTNVLKKDGITEFK